jgi:hypothetical protein
MYRSATVVGLSVALTLGSVTGVVAADQARPGAVDLEFNAGAGFGREEGNTPEIYGDIVGTETGFLVGGAFDSYRGFDTPGIVAIRNDGSSDPNFRLEVSPIQIRFGDTLVEFGNNVFAIEPIGNSFYLLGGQFADGDTIKLVDQFGREDPSFRFEEPPSSGRNGFPDRGFNGFVFDIETVAPGVFLVGGQFSRFSKRPAKGVARVILGEDRVLRLDPTFESQLNIKDRRRTALRDPMIFTIATRPDDSILIGGIFDKYQGEKVGSIAQISTRGELMSTFEGGARAGRENGQVFSIVQQPNSPAVVGGSFTSFGSDSAARGLAVLGGQRVRSQAPRLVQATLGDCVERTDATGGAQAVSPVALEVHKIVPTRNGGYVIAGRFNGLVNVDGSSHNSVGVARLNSDLTADWTFMDSRGRPGGLFDACPDGSLMPGRGMTIGELEGERIVAGGFFNTAFDVQTLRPVNAPNITMLWDTKLEDTALIPRTPIVPEVKSVSEKELVDIVFAVSGRANDQREETWVYRQGEIGTARTEGGPCEIVERVPFDELNPGYDTVTVQHRPRSGAGTYICARQVLATNLRELASDFSYILIEG